MSLMKYIFQYGNLIYGSLMAASAALCHYGKGVCLDAANRNHAFEARRDGLMR